jgi:hypothetical protein
MRVLAVNAPADSLLAGGAHVCCNRSGVLRDRRDVKKKTKFMNFFTFLILFS